MFYKLEYLVNKSKPDITEKLRTALNALGGTESSSEDATFVFVIGGDGTLFHFIKEYAFQSKKLIGIKNGKTAFLLDFEVDSLEDLSNRKWQNVELLKLEGKDECHFAAGDVLIVGKLFLEAKIYINDQFLEGFRGSGLLFSTKLGSTGLNKSMKGPVLLANSDLWTMGEIGTCNTNKQSSLGVPIVLSGSDTVRIDILSKKGFRLFIDGRNITFKGGKTLTLSFIKGDAKVLEFDSKRYINKMRDVFLV